MKKRACVYVCVFLYVCALKIHMILSLNTFYKIMIHFLRKLIRISGGFGACFASHQRSIGYNSYRNQKKMLILSLIYMTPQNFLINLIQNTTKRNKIWLCSIKKWVIGAIFINSYSFSARNFLSSDTFSSFCTFYVYRKYKFLLSTT